MQARPGRSSSSRAPALAQLSAAIKLMGPGAKKIIATGRRRAGCRRSRGVALSGPSDPVDCGLFDDMTKRKQNAVWCGKASRAI